MVGLLGVVGSCLFGFVVVVSSFVKLFFFTGYNIALLLTGFCISF